MECIPKCTSCTGLCLTVQTRTAVRTRKPSPSANWAPNALQLVRLPCGHVGIPWPVIHKLGDHFVSILCDRCDKWIPVTAKDKKSWKNLLGDIDTNGQSPLF